MANSKKKSAFEALETELVNEAGNYVKEKIKRKALKIGEVSILIILGFILISFGIANILASFYPILAGGYSYLLVGIFFLVASFVIRV